VNIQRSHQLYTGREGVTAVPISRRQNGFAAALPVTTRSPLSRLGDKSAAARGGGWAG